MSIGRRRLLQGALSTVAMVSYSKRSLAQSPKRVSFLLDVLTNPKHALFYPAAKQGLFTGQGLDVTLEVGKGSADVIQNVASGTAQFGFADASAVVLGRARGLPITLVTMVHYNTLMTVITRVPSGVTKPAELVGKKIASTGGDAVRMVMPAFAKVNGFEADKINFITVNQPAKASMLLAGQVDGVCDYLSAFPIYSEAAQAVGLGLKAISFAEYGLDIYSNGIIVHDDLLKSDPALVSSFVRAIVMSLNVAASEREATIKLFREFQPQYSEKVSREGLDIAANALLVPEVFNNGIGAMSRDKIERTIQTTIQAYSLDKSPPAASVYTNAMLPGIFPRKS
jgi:NitT/TauT family transport system substrate-binding protein